VLKQKDEQMNTETNVKLGEFELTKEQGGTFVARSKTCAIYLPTTADDVQAAIRALEQLLKF
jgi:hypothetical protein